MATRRASRPKQTAGLTSRAAARSARPELARERLAALAAALPDLTHWDPKGAAALACALAGSEAVARHVSAEPELSRPILRGEYVTERKPREVMRDELRRRRALATTDAELEQAVAAYRVGEWVRLVARELSRRAPVEEVLAELSDLALEVIDALARHVLRRDRSQHGRRTEATPAGPRAAGFLVLAQGKLGGGELNLSSDVDLQLIYSSDDGPPEAKLTLHERFRQIGRRLVQALSQGAGYRVDLALRPEGQKGALVNSLAGLERYYEAFGQTWERLALIRRERTGGAAWLMTALEEALSPFVFPRAVLFDAVEEIGALAARLRDEQGTRAGGVDVKRAAGGIRELELFVQILQCLHGGRDPSLRVRPIPEAASRLAFAGHLSSQERDALVDAYRFLRRLENALQARQELQTHVFPEDPQERELLANLLGDKRPGAGERLAKKLMRQRARVSAVTSRLFGKPQPGEAAPARLALSTDPEAQVLGLSRLGLAGVELDEARQVLAALRAAPGGPFSERASARLRRLAEPLLEDLLQSPEPHQALRLFAGLDRVLRLRPLAYELLAADAALRRRLSDLLGTSEFLGRALSAYPELIDRLASLRDPAAEAAAPGVPALEAEASARTRRLGDLELELRSLRRFKLQEVLRIGVLDVAGELDVEAVGAQLTDLAEACLHTAFGIANRGAGAFTAGFVVLGLGRLGAREMGYGSDLDLLFVFDEDAGEGARERAVQLSQRLIRQLTFALEEGPLYAIDTRLRPSGNQGPLVTSEHGFVSYHRQKAMLWERQALLRARPVAGDLALGARVLGALDGVRYGRLEPGARAEVHRMRLRLQDSRPRRDGVSLKTGPGGLADIEFLVQYLVLQHAFTHPALRVTGTAAGLAALTGAGVLSPKQGEGLIRAYRFLRFLENRLRIVQDRPIDEVLMSQEAWGKLARRLGPGAGAPSGARLRSEYERVAAWVRRTYEQMLRPNEA